MLYHGGAVRKNYEIIYELLIYHIMTDIKIMIEATRQLKQAWESTCCDVKGEAITNELYDALCEVDEAVGNLIEKVGDATKTIVIGSINK